MKDESLKDETKRSFCYVSVQVTNWQSHFSVSIHLFKSQVKIMRGTDPRNMRRIRFVQQPTHPFLFQPNTSESAAFSARSCIVNLLAGTGKLWAQSWELQSPIYRPQATAPSTLLVSSKSQLLLYPLCLKYSRLT
jgi:hypothetical protein